MKNKDTRKIAEEISFRLLATKDHVDFDWLVDKLSELKSDNTKKKPILPCIGHAFEEDCSDYGDAFEY